MKFKGSETYVATPDLMLAVNAAARSSARCWSRASPAPARRCWPRKWPRHSSMPLLQWHIKSTTKAQQGLYEYDAVSRLRDSQLADSRRRARQGHPQLHRQGRAVAGVHRRRAGGAPDRRDRQGRHRVPERPAARNRPDGVLRLRDARARQGEAPAARLHHLQQREGAARRVPAPLLLPLHQVPRRRDDEAASSPCTSPASRRSCSAPR